LRHSLRSIFMSHFVIQQTVRRCLIIFSLLMLLSLSLSGCASIKDWFGFGSSTIQQSADSLAMAGMDDYHAGKYFSALKNFEEIMDRYPFSPQSMLAELKAADCHYFQEEFLEAKVLYQEFEDRHPTNEAIPYVMFQIGMCDFNRTDRIDRDTSGAEEAIQSFSRLLRAFPNSPYTGEAKARIRSAQEFLANHEYFVAVFYVKTDKFDEATHRLKYLLATYPSSAIALKARTLLERIEAGNPPNMGLSSWLPDLSLPDFHLFGSGNEKKDMEKPSEDTTKK